MNAASFRFRKALRCCPPAQGSFASTGGVLLGKDYRVRSRASRHRSLWRQSAARRQSVHGLLRSLSGRIVQLRRVEYRASASAMGRASRCKRPIGPSPTVALGAMPDGLMRVAMAIAGYGCHRRRTARPSPARVSMDLRRSLDVTDLAAERSSSSAARSNSSAT